MRADALIQNMKSDACKAMIVRNLNRILDVRIIEIDMEEHLLCFVYKTQRAFEDVRKELLRIGYPMKGYVLIC